jgi:hypothetical protein
VVDIDTITSFDGVDRRKWFFNSFEGSEVIEGIGNINGVLTPFFVYFEYWENLFCFTVDTTQVYPFPYQSNCILPSDTCLTVGVSEWGKPESAGQSLIAYPNPATDFVFLKTTDENLSLDAHLQIMDYTGKMVFNNRIQAKQMKGEVINISNWPSGIYIATISNNGQINGKCKFVVE